jgi:hypothetical protein
MELQSWTVDQVGNPERLALTRGMTALLLNNSAGGAPPTVTLTIEPASVRATAIIFTPSRTAAQSYVNVLASQTAQSISAVVGAQYTGTSTAALTVDALEGPSIRPVTQQTPLPPAPPPPPPPPPPPLPAAASSPKPLDHYETMVADGLFHQVAKGSDSIPVAVMGDYLSSRGDISAKTIESMVLDMDSNGDGHIDLHEWRRAWKTFGKDRSAEEEVEQPLAAVMATAEEQVAQRTLHAAWSAL